MLIKYNGNISLKKSKVLVTSLIKLKCVILYRVFRSSPVKLKCRILEMILWLFEQTHRFLKLQKHRNESKTGTFVFILLVRGSFFSECFVLFIVAEADVPTGCLLPYLPVNSKRNFLSSVCLSSICWRDNSKTVLWKNFKFCL